jgi:hypothetical protein
MRGQRLQRRTQARASSSARASDVDSSQGQELERLKQEIERLREQIAERAKQIADLERQLALRQQNSTTSSKPPSSDGLAGRQRERGRRQKSRRQPGGQLGHPGHCRPLVPLARVNQIVEILPNACRHWRLAHQLTPCRSIRRRVTVAHPGQILTSCL